MTSIEWLVKELYTEMNMSGDGRVLDEILEEAKEMHKQEIIKAQSYAISNADMTNNKGYFDCEKYYQETFGSKGSETFKVWDCCGMEECICKGNDVEKLALEWNNGEMPMHYHKREGFKVGYNKAKETLYTEEQLIGFSKWADDCGYMYNGSANCWYTQDGYKRTDEEMIWMYKQSLKQPKKD